LSVCCHYFSITISTFYQLWCGVVYCNILSFIGALVLLKKLFFLLSLFAVCIVNNTLKCVRMGE